MSYDLLIKNGTVVDGTGSKPRRADVAIAAGKVAEIGKVVEGAKKIIEASDLIVAPVSSIRTPITTPRSVGTLISPRLHGMG